MATAATQAKPNAGVRLSADWLVPVATVSLVFMMLVPVPSVVLDIFLATSVTLGIVVLLSALYILKPVQFSVFPTLLLFLTLFRISLNIASSRRILLHGNEGASAAGHVIEAFGQFVVGGNYVVGFVIFLALIAIQYLVINHGAVRTAEVAARFTLDAMPGKQMAIDADMNAGLIDESQARARREQIAKEAEFYGAMDGAARFSQRDALATILITAINIVAGFLIGVIQLHIPFEEALKTYTVLTVGDGLVTMIPSLLVSVAGGIVVTRTSTDNVLGVELGKQLLSKKMPLRIAAGVMFFLGLIPGLPKLSFFALAALTYYLSTRASKQAAAESAVAGGAAKKDTKASNQQQLEQLLKLDELSLEVGYGLVSLVDQGQGGQLLQRIRALRRHLALQLGFVVPSIHITDNMKLKPREYVIHLRGVEIARWQMYQDYVLAIASDPNPAPLEGFETHEPAFGTAARWIAPVLQDQALAKGYVVVDQTSVLATHIAEIVRQFAYELLTRHEVKRLLDALAETRPKLVDELVPKLLTLGEVQRVLQQLLREQVSIRDLSTILEVLIDTAATNKSQVALVEATRQALGRALVQPLLSDERKLKVMTLDPTLEQQIQRSFEPQNGDRTALGHPSPLRRILESLQKSVSDKVALNSMTLLCNSPARFHLRRLLEPFLPRVVVLSPAEIPATVSVQSLGVVR